MLKVLITGSGSRYEVAPGGNIVGEDKFKEFLYSLGGALAEKKHQVILLSDNDRHAEPYVLRGYAERSASDGFRTPPVRISYGSPQIPRTLLP